MYFLIKLADAERHLIQRSQEETFIEELGLLRLGRPLHSSSCIVQLPPATDGSMLRAGGGTGNATAMPEGARRPTILDPKHPFTRLLIHHHHCANGQERVMNEFRQWYWILRMRSAVGRLGTHAKHARSRVQCRDHRRWDLCRPVALLERFCAGQITDTDTYRRYVKSIRNLRVLCRRPRNYVYVQF